MRLNGPATANTRVRGNAASIVPAATVLVVGMEQKTLHQVSRRMRKSIRVEKNEEPLGIVISGGSRDEALPKFAAYVWGPAPEGADTPESKAA